MDIERLTARSKDGFAYLVNVKPDEQEVNSPHKNTLKCILDCFERLAQYEEEAIARQSVKSEEIQEAIDLLMELQHDNYVFQNYTEQDVKNYGLISIAITALQAYQPTTRKDRTVEPVAISKTETTSKSCWYCDGIQDHKVVFVKTVVDELGRELPAYDTPYNYCPNCGRRLEEKT